MKRISILGLFVFLSCIIISCSEDDITPPEFKDKLIEISSVTSQDGEVIVKLFSEKSSLTVGYNTLYYDIKNKSGETLRNVQMEVSPLMQMNTGMQHSAPYYETVFDQSIDLYAGSVVFVMPSTAGEWSLQVSLDGSTSLEMPVNIVMPDESRLLSFQHEGESYFLSLVQPTAPDVGINDFVLTIHKRASMMDWPPVDDFEISIEPEMPMMGHGSPNNVDPESQGNGFYAGKVNFTMDGYWKVNMELMKNGNPVDADLAFDITFSVNQNPQ